MSSRCFASVIKTFRHVGPTRIFMTSPMDPSDDLSRGALVQQGHRELRAADQEAPRRCAEWLLGDVLDCSRTELYTESGQAVPARAARRYWAMVERCVKGEPLQHVLGYTSFRGLRIEVSPDVMIPRPETEELVEVALNAVSSVDEPRVLDVGTGSGCIALTIKHERPDAEVQGWDVSADALRVARTNRKKLEIEVSFSEVDILADKIEAPDLPVDLLVSNPPYIPKSEADALPPEVRDYDPDVALFTGDDPLRFYRVLARRAGALCADGAALVLETHTDYADAAATVLREAGLADVSITNDLSGHPRILTAHYGSPEGP